MFSLLDQLTGSIPLSKTIKIFLSNKRLQKYFSPRMYTRSCVKNSSDLPRGWKKITVNLLNSEDTAFLYISPEGKRFGDVQSARAWIARSIEESCNSDIIEAPRRFTWRAREEKVVNVTRNRTGRRGARHSKSLLQTALKRKLKTRIVKRNDRQSSKLSANISNTGKRIQKAVVNRIKKTIGVRGKT